MSKLSSLFREPYKKGFVLLILDCPFILQFSSTKWRLKFRTFFVFFNQYTEADLYRQLTYFCYTLDTVRCISKVRFQFLTNLLVVVGLKIELLILKDEKHVQMEIDKRLAVEKEVARIRPLVETAASTVEKIRDRCAYGWVQLKDFVVLV